MRIGRPHSAKADFGYANRLMRINSRHSHVIHNIRIAYEDINTRHSYR